MSHVGLYHLSSHIRYCQLAELREQVLLQHEATMLLSRVLVHWQNRCIPFVRKCLKRHSRPRWRFVATGRCDSLVESVRCLLSRDLTQRFVLKNLFTRSVGSNFNLPPANRPPPSSFEKTTAAVLSFASSHSRNPPFSRWLFVLYLERHCRHFGLQRFMRFESV